MHRRQNVVGSDLSHMLSAWFFMHCDSDAQMRLRILYSFVNMTSAFSRFRRESMVCYGVKLSAADFVLAEITIHHLISRFLEIFLSSIIVSPMMPMADERWDMRWTVKVYSGDFETISKAISNEKCRSTSFEQFHRSLWCESMNDWAVSR